jgi:hypothetical protein
VPVTEPLAAVRVKVELLIVAALIAWLKVTVTVELTATAEAPVAGVVAVTVGAVGGGVVPVPEPELPPPHPATIRAERISIEVTARITTLQQFTGTGFGRTGTGRKNNLANLKLPLGIRFSIAGFLEEGAPGFREPAVPAFNDRPIVNQFSNSTQSLICHAVPRLPRAAFGFVLSRLEGESPQERITAIDALEPSRRLGL